MSVNIWLISDTHFGHSNIIDYCGRPFQDEYVMDNQLIENWNSAISPEDHVYHLGDVYLGKSNGYADAILHQLNGKKRLVLGNHDNLRDKILLKHFEKIVLVRDWKEHGLLLSHIPLHLGSIKKGRVNVHGHIHNQNSPEGPYINVCVEKTNYRPVHIEDVAKQAKELNEQLERPKIQSRRR